MSIQAIKEARDRINKTPASSPLALFKCDKPGCVDLVFANTLETRRLISERGPDFIAVLHGEPNKLAIAGFLELAVGRDLDECGDV